MLHKREQNLEHFAASLQITPSKPDKEIDNKTRLVNDPHKQIIFMISNLIHNNDHIMMNWR